MQGETSKQWLYEKEKVAYKEATECVNTTELR
jgi:hypothetical protein